MPADGDSNLGSCLKNYLAIDRKKTKMLLPGPTADIDTKVFEHNVLNITSRLDDFLQSPQKEIALLVLGKIQSGKTANLLATVAWAADSKVSLAVIFTGVTEALNDQTEKRIKKDLITKLDEQYVKVFPVPTKASGEGYDILLKELSKWISRRNSENVAGLIRPIPVLVTLKNPSRVKTLHKLIEDLQEKFGNDLVSLLIDDEADQASQNAGARKRKITPTYAAISALRDLDSRNIMLSYTATPQAVLLTERNGRLRPNFCVTVEPRTNYFGLEKAVNESFQHNRIQVDDWVDKPSEMQNSPKSLRDALITFACTAWVRFYDPATFYHAGKMAEEALEKQLKSIQMLVHESSAVKEHRKVYQFVSWELERLTEGLVDAISGSLTSGQLQFLEEEWESGLATIRASIDPNLAKALNPLKGIEFYKQILSLLDDAKILVVNSDPNRPGPEEDMPIDDEDWVQNKLWVLIGGDILGRGLTIPQLTTTYFLRHAKSPNFDTVSQQMRFCGYRSNYSQFTQLFAQGQTFGIFEVMNEIDSTVWRLAKKWDKERLNIFNEMPVVMYASRPNIKLEPCRKAVHDPDLVDIKVGNVIFSSRDIFHPTRFKENIQHIRSFVEESQIETDSHEDWYILKEPTDLQMQRLLVGWEANATESTFLIGAAELFVPELEELGLSNIPRNIVIHKSLLDSDLRDPDDIESQISVTRGVRPSHKNANIRNWKKAFQTLPIAGLPKIEWPALRVGHIGEGQRAIRETYSPLATTLLLEPIFGHEGKSKDGEKVAVGLAFSLFSPPNFEVRMIGLQSRLHTLDAV